MPCILTIDQSTSATKALLINDRGRCLDRELRVHAQHYPQPGWVEHDAEEIWCNVVKVARALISRNPKEAGEIVGLSITNQRETIVVFDRDTGKPLCPAIVWQCRRSEQICRRHLAAGHEALIRARTGLRIDPYFSASKIQWILENRPELNDKLVRGEALIGTMDSYLIYRLTEGRVHATDHTNASRTLLYDIVRMRWDVELCALWSIPLHSLPEVRESSEGFGETSLENSIEFSLPIVGVMGDSQASLFAQHCFEPGIAKVTFGTGSSVLMNIGSQAQFSSKGVLTALAWVKNGKPVYAFEGIIIHSASTLNWLKHQLNFVKDVAEIEVLAREVDDTGGVYLVPAFSGLGLPNWESKARAAIVGLSGYSDRRHIARAAMESIAYQLCDTLDAMQEEGGMEVRTLKTDGRPTKNRLLMQFTADVTHTRLLVSSTPDYSALGAALMGYIGLGMFPSPESLLTFRNNYIVYDPRMSASAVRSLRTGWRRAVNQVLAGIN